MKLGKYLLKSVAVVAVLVMGPLGAVAEADLRVDASIKPVQLAVGGHTILDSDAKNDLLISSHTIVSLVGSGKDLGVEGLQKALWDYSDKAIQLHQDIRTKMIPQAMEDRDERLKGGGTFFPTFESKHDVYIRRADTLATSLLEYSSSYEGGAHGMYGVWGRNFDSKTGKELELMDVFKDANILIGAIETQLRRDYPKASFIEGTLMEEMVEKMVLDCSITWTLDPTGVSFYFNPYLIGSYSEGIFTTTILFDEYPNLFKEKYCRMPVSYCMELRPFLPVRTLFADGSGTAVKIGSTDSGLLVMANGSELADSGEAYMSRPVLVSLADGRRYVYVDTLEAGDICQRTRVYDITTGRPVVVPMQEWLTRRGEIPENFAQLKDDKDLDEIFYVMSNPENFSMTKLDESTGKANQCYCSVGPNGAPVIK